MRAYIGIKHKLCTREKSNGLGVRNDVVRRNFGGGIMRDE
jgi:hypothetical protein